MVKKIIFLLAVVILSVSEGSFSFAQEAKTQFIHKGILRATATISPGKLIDANGTTISLHGILEYYVANNISIRGDSYYFLKGSFLNRYDLLEVNHEMLAGVSYHFKTKNHFDPYLTLEPGVSITRVSEHPDDKYYIRSTTANPLISFGAGFNYYFERWFHLFAETRYISGKYMAMDYHPGSLSLNEIKFSFGLGFNLNVFKPKTASSGNN
jgi:hypothetical protein